MLKFSPIPKYAKDYSKIATNLEAMNLPFYCINCRHKEETTYLTPDFGPFCKDCIKKIKPLLREEIF